MSDRLDIVRLIDSKVSATRRTVARSKQLADAAKDDLTTHKEWLERHQRLAQEESERHLRRLSRTRRAEACKHFALWLLLLVPSACAAMFRAGGAGLAALGETFYFGCRWIGRTAYGGGRSLARLVAGSITWIGTSVLTLALWLAAGLWIVLSLLGTSSREVAVSAVGAGSRGVSWIGPRSRSLSQRLGVALSFGVSRLSTLTMSVGGRVARTIEGQIKTLATRSREDGQLPLERREPSFDPRRLQAAAFVRLRAEHDRLQARIHAMDRSYGSRVPPRGRPDVAEWAQLRKLARDARRLFEIQEAGMLGPAAPNRNGRSLALQPDGATLAASVHSSRVGQIAARRRARRQPRR
ncbi:MAG TPA: hypothetical protein VFK91_01505 [Methyloceanibacter sp.]|nr:hypothetical protein [Methyloceanibacter sp.]